LTLDILAYPPDELGLANRRVLLPVGYPGCYNFFWKLNFDPSISYTPDPATLKDSKRFCLAKLIFQNPSIFSAIAMVNNL